MTRTRFFSNLTAKNICDEETALAVLLANEIVWAVPGDSVFTGPANDPTPVTIVVGANDTFAYASADAEPLPHNEIGNLYRASKTPHGIARWLALRRKQLPLPQIVEVMKRDGAWDEDLQRLERAFTGNG